MKDLFEKNRPRMTPDEDRKVWGAMRSAVQEQQGARRNRRRFGWGAGALAVVTTAVVAIAITQGVNHSARDALLAEQQTGPLPVELHDESAAAVEQDAAGDGADTDAAPPAISPHVRARDFGTDAAGEVAADPARKDMRASAQQEGLRNRPAPAEMKNEANEPVLMDEVKITAEREMIDLRSSTTSYSIGQEQLESLPVDELQDASGDKNETAKRRQPAAAPQANAPAPATPGAPIPVGGTAPVNDVQVDAMFFRHYGVNPFVDPQEDRFATFAVDVDQASYTLTRNYLARGMLPPVEAVRVEEFVNRFDHGYAPPQGSFTADREATPSVHGTFGVQLDAAPSPFGDGLTLVRVGIKGREVEAQDRKPSRLTFVIDVSGSMNRENRLGLVKRSLFLLLDQMRTDDQMALVVYGSQARVICPPTNDRATIEHAINALQPEGSTNAEAGLVEAYRLADRMRTAGANNRVILCSDGVANVGNTGADSILERIARQADAGIYLTTVGFGMGNYNDVLMEQLANKGDGNYYYVDDIVEARRVFVDHITGTLEVIARQTKIQVEFDTRHVRRYRLLGYENRDVADRDFRNDAVDAGEVGAGHEVTALFELKLEGTPRRGELATVRIRYEDPATGRVTEEAHTLQVQDVARDARDLDPTFRLDAAVAEFAEILRHSYWARDAELGPVLGMAREVSGELGRPAAIDELVGMIGQARSLWQPAPTGTWDTRPAWEPGSDGGQR